MPGKNENLRTCNLSETKLSQEKYPLKKEKDISPSSPPDNPGGKALAPSPDIRGIVISPTKEKIIEKKPGPDKLFNSAVAHSRENRLEEALNEYANVLALDPFYGDAYNNRGVIYQKMGKLDLAIKEYREALSIDRKNEKALNNLGIACYRKKNYEKAINWYRRCLEINPQNLPAHNNLGIACQKTDRPEEARAVFLKALRIDPCHGETHYNLASFFEIQGDAGRAILHYRKFMECSSEYYPQLKNRVNDRIRLLRYHLEKIN